MRYNNYVFKLFLCNEYSTKKKIVKKKIIMYYSLAGEDKFLNESYFKDKKKGIYMEIGAADGISQSNTKFFEDSLEWTGILVEPNSVTFQNLKKNRPNNMLFHELVSNKDQKYTFQYLESVDLVGGIKETLPELHNNSWYGSHAKETGQNIIEEEIQATSLTRIIQQCPFDHIDFFSLDVEGHELEVLNSWDFSIPIYLILLETLDRDDHEKMITRKCAEKLEQHGYRFDKKIAHNQVFILKNSYLDV